MRIEFHLGDLEERASGLERDFEPVAREFCMDWRLARAYPPKRLAVFVSLAEHALLELLWRRRAGDLPADILLVVSNHDGLRATAESWDIPYFHVPVTPETRVNAESRQLELCAQFEVDTIVLARYMQVLSPAFLARYPQQIINIHHSFLPAFAGANPYEAAFRRGVKLIGATAHYVSEELDAGPIIEQDIERVDHRRTPGDLQRIGRYVERVVLARAVTWHVEDRVLIHGNRTIVFA